MVIVTAPQWSVSLVFRFFTKPALSPQTGARFPPPNIGCLFTVQCGNTVLFLKCGNISRQDECFHPQRGATYHMSRPGSQRKKRKRGWQGQAGKGGCVCGGGGLLCTQEKHSKLPKCQRTFTAGRLMQPGATWEPRGLTSDRPAVQQWENREGTKAWGSVTIRRDSHPLCCCCS